MSDLPKHIHNDYPYILDYLCEDNSITALTLKNSEFIEAVVGLDSNYSRESKDTPPDNKYGGSTFYWFNKMQNGSNFKECLSEFISAIDRSNSTHLEASNDGEKSGRQIVLDRILARCQNVDDLKHALENKIVDENHLIGVLCASMAAKRGERYNLSFATKLCSYAAEYFKLSVQYPKYDNVVASNLPKYTMYYLNEDENANTYLINDAEKRRCKGDRAANLKLRLDKYNHYRKSLDSIKAKLCANNIDLSLSEIDHIIWYCNK